MLLPKSLCWYQSLPGHSAINMKPFIERKSEEMRAAHTFIWQSPCVLPPGHSAESGWTVSAHRWRQWGCHGLAGVGPQTALCLPRVWCWNPIHGPVLWPKVRPSLVWTSVLENTYLKLNWTFVFVLIVIFCGSQILGIILRILSWQKWFF